MTNLTFFFSLLCVDSCSSCSLSLHSPVSRIKERVSLYPLPLMTPPRNYIHCFYTVTISILWPKLSHMATPGSKGVWTI